MSLCKRQHMAFWLEAVCESKGGDKCSCLRWIIFTTGQCSGGERDQAFSYFYILFFSSRQCSVFFFLLSADWKKSSHKLWTLLWNIEDRRRYIQVFTQLIFSIFSCIYKAMIFNGLLYLAHLRKCSVYFEDVWMSCTHKFGQFAMLSSKLLHIRHLGNIIRS